MLFSVFTPGFWRASSLIYPFLYSAKTTETFSSHLDAWSQYKPKRKKPTPRVRVCINKKENVTFDTRRNYERVHILIPGRNNQAWLYPHESLFIAHISLLIPRALVPFLLFNLSIKSSITLQRLNRGWVVLLRGALPPPALFSPLAVWSMVLYVALLLSTAVMNGKVILLHVSFLFKSIHMWRNKGEGIFSFPLFS